MQQFLEAIFADAVGPDRRLSIFTTPDKRCRRFEAITDAVDYVHTRAGDCNVYFGLGLIRGEPAGRGTARDVAALGGLWADLDLAGDAHANANLPRDTDQLRAILAKIGLPPSILVHSGHGLHAYWLFSEPWIFDSDAERGQAATLARRWHGTVCAVAKQMGWSMENLGDLARVLRLPNTLNHNGTEPVAVRILEQDLSRRYDPDDFDAYLADETRTDDAGTADIAPLVLAPDAEPPAVKLLELASQSELFWRTWNRQRDDLPDQSQSGYDLSLANTAAKAGWSDQQIADLIIAARRHHNQTPKKALREDYIRRTLRLARGDAASDGASIDLSGIAPGVMAPPPPGVDDPGPFPQHLLDVPGFIVEVAQHTLRTAPYPQPVLAFAGALALQAFLAGRKVRDISDARTNLYVLALANSGAGKDHPRKVNQRVLFEAGVQDCLGDKFASGEGIEDRLFAQPSMLFQTDEIDGLMQSINRAGDARHESILNVLLKMYTSGNSIYPMRVKAGKEAPGIIDQPSLCMLGTAVPKYYYEALSMRMLNNGFFARLLILEAEKRGEGQDPTFTELPQRVIDTAKWWASFKPGAEGNLSSWHPRPHLVPCTDEAGDVLTELRREADRQYADAEGRDDPTAMAIWARAYEKARKLALIYAVSASHEHPRIEAPAARWAGELVDHQTRRMLFMAAQHVAEGEFDAKCKRMIEVLTGWERNHGAKWMPHWYLARRLKWSDREIDEVREALVGQERIEFNIGSTVRGGRSASRYRMPQRCDQPM